MAEAARLTNVPAERYIPFKVSSTVDLENKKRLGEAPKRRSHVRTASVAGDVQSVLSFLETIQDPQEATSLALDAHKYLSRYRHTKALQLLEQECDGIFGSEDFQRRKSTLSGDGRATSPAGGGRGGGLSGAVPPPVEYDYKTAQIKTGTIGSFLVHMDRAIDLPIKDGTAGSSDPFVRIRLWEGKGGNKRCVADKSTQIKVMTLSPVFDEKFVLDISSPDCELELTAYDWDEDGTHDFMGKVTMPLRDFIQDLMQQRDNTYQQNLEAARTVARTAGSKNIVGRSLGGTAQTTVNEIYGAATEFGRVGWNGATGIQALATTIQRSSELAELRPKLHHSKLKGVGGMDSTDGGMLVFTTTFVPAARPKTIANIPMFPRKTLEHITPMTPADQLIFEGKEFLHSSVADDASWAKNRTLTDDVMWPKDAAVQTASMETSLSMRRTVAHLGWRNLIEPTRPYRQPLPPKVCKVPKTGLDEIEEKAHEVRKQDEDISIRLADRLWGQKIETQKVSLQTRLQRAAGKALDGRAYRTRAEASSAITKGKAEFEEYKYREAILSFENALSIATSG